MKNHHLPSCCCFTMEQRDFFTNYKEREELELSCLRKCNLSSSKNPEK